MQIDIFYMIIYSMDIQSWIEHINKAYDDAYNNKSKLSDDIITMKGMSGKQTRHLYNNICNKDGITYLEVGTYTGSSLISSIYKNNITAYAVENWSEFEGPKEEFISNVQKLLSNEPYILIEKDFHQVTEEDVTKKIDIFMYDGMHTYDCQYESIKYFYPFYADTFIILVDDWFFPIVSEPTLKALGELDITIHHKLEIVTQEEFGDGKETFWNGFGLFLCSKK
jgi:hypothetical protein